MKQFLLFIFCLFVLSCTHDKGNQITVRLDKNYDQPARGITILYPLSEMEDSIYKEIAFPDLSNVSDTVFAKTFFTGNNQSALENNVLLLVVNWSSKSPSIWVDQNNNLDLTDDNTPLSFSEEFIDISIPNGSNNELFYIVRLIKPDSSQKAQHKEMIVKYITKGKPYAGFYFDQRRNIKVGDFVYEQDSLRIGIVDWNVNGIYNDVGEDRIVLGEFQGTIKGIDEASGAIVLDTTTYFQGISKAFEIIEVAADGKSIQLKPTLSSNVEDRIVQGQPIPNFSFKLLSGDQTSISEFLDENKMLYLNFWATWCAGCHQEIEDLKKIHSDFSDRIHLISLNYNEEAQKIESFIGKYQVDWLNGYSSTEINQKLFVQGLPRNILIDSTGTIIEMNSHPQNLLARFGDG